METKEQTITAPAPADNTLRVELPLPGYVPVTPDMAEKLRPYFAIGLYLSKTMSLRAAAGVAGMDYGEFDTLLGELGVPCSLMTYEDVLADCAKIEAHRREVQAAAV